MFMFKAEALRPFSRVDVGREEKALKDLEVF